MYQIIKNRILVDLAESIVYNRMQPNGYYGLATEPTAQGIVANGVVYHLEGRPRDGYEDCDSVTYEIVNAVDAVFAEIMQIVRGEIEPEPIPNEVVE